MPFLRFSRDKRGYENTYLVETIHRRGKPARTKILYWYRSPPGVRVGRKPFDDEVRKTLEAQNPGVRFDWAALAATPMPAAEPEPWWERRRAERMARQARRADDQDAEVAEQVPVADEPVEPEPVVSEVLGDELASAGEAEGESAAPVAVTSGQPAQTPSSGRRRRRGGRRRRGRGDGPAPGAQASGGNPPRSEPPEQNSESVPDPADPPTSSSEG